MPPPEHPGSWPAKRRGVLMLASLLVCCVPATRPPPERPSVDPATGGGAVSGVPGAPPPQNPRERALWRATTEPDLGTRAELLSAITRDAPPSDRVGRLARVELVKTLAERGALAEMERTAGDLEIGDDSEGADLLNRMAYAAAEHGGDLEKAATRARRALEIVSGMRRPPGVPSDLWKRQTASTSAGIRDTLGWVLVRAGDPAEGLRQLDLAAEITPDDGAVNFHRGQALEARGKARQALEAYARAVAGEGEESASARAGAFRMGGKLELREGEVSALLEAASASLGARLRERVVAHPVDQPAPELTAHDEGGAEVRLSSRRGRMVLLVFFASYNAPSLQALRASAELAPLALVAVSEDPVASNAHAAAARFGVGFPLGLDPEGVDASAWGVKSLPLVAVLDTAGHVRYRNEGMVPGYGRMLKMELESLEGAHQ